MTECRECAISIPESANFCPSCGAPQNEEAARALESFTKKRLKEMSAEEREALLDEDEQLAADSKLVSRFLTALGWITIVGGIALLPEIASGPVIIAGIVILPTIQRVLDRVLDRSLGVIPFVGIYTIALAVAAVLFFVL